MRIAIDLNDVIRDYTGQFIKYYKKTIDSDFEIEPKDVDEFDFTLVFPFKDRSEYEQFNYLDCAFEIYGRAETKDKLLAVKLNNWLQNTLREFEEDKIPEVFFVSPLEIGLTIQSTYAFLAKIGTRVREMWFPADSTKIWDRCDILITANPRLLESKPEGKTAIKIETGYNKDTDADYTFDSMTSLIDDKEETIINLINEQDEHRD